MGGMRNAYKILFGKPRSMWADNIRMNIKEMGGRVWT
jgi:hypothetical protein